MKTWKDYKEYLKTIDPIIGKDISEIENLTQLIQDKQLVYLIQKLRDIGLTSDEILNIIECIGMRGLKEDVK